MKLRPSLLPQSIRCYSLLAVVVVSVGLYGVYIVKYDAESVTEANSTVTGTVNLTADIGTYLPSATIEVGGARIHNYDFNIVQQDGSVGQVNPPVNLYGTHLAARGDFEITASIKQVTQAASLRFYSEPPIIQDEFRVEPSSMELVLGDGILVISLWDQSARVPTFVRPYDIENLADYANIVVSRISNTLNITVNNKQVAQVPADSIFKSGSIWFGASGQGGDFLLSNLEAKSINQGQLQAIRSSMLNVTPSRGGTLQGLATKYRPGFIIGAAMALGPAVADEQYSHVGFNGNFGAITTENALKWQFVEPQRGVYTFQDGDALLDMASRHGMVLHGHTLVFGEANPMWVTELPHVTETEKIAVEQVMVNHIEQVIGHYRGKIPTWDVVNEPLADYDEFENGAVLRDSIWYRAMGEAYIAKAFRAARQMDPEAKLFMNEYGLEADGERWDKFLNLVTRLKRAGVPIDGVGFQAHVYEADDKINTAALVRHMRQLAEIGLESRISEIDVYSDDGTTIQAEQFSSILMACLNEPSCISWTTWGISDRYDMFLENGEVKYGHDLLWDDEMQPTKALQMILTRLQPSNVK